MCCGANGTADWAMSEYAVNNSVAVPPSCCMVETAECNAGQPGMPTKLSGLYEDVSLNKYGYMKSLVAKQLLSILHVSHFLFSKINEQTSIL